jgi:cytochrome P450
MALPPGPSASPLVQTLRWIFRPIAFLEECRRRYGDSFSITFLGFERPMVMVSHPDAVRALYSGRENGLPPGRALQLEPALGARSVLLLEGREHLDRRKLMLPPFHGERMRAFGPEVEAIVEREIDSWPKGETFPIHPRMQAITLEVILRVVFGVTDPERAQRLRELLPKLLGAFSNPLVQLGMVLTRSVPGIDPVAALRKAIAPVDELIYAEIDEHAEGEDILSMLKAARFEDGEPMSRTELRDQLVTLLLAGHETTATGLAWTVDLLGRHPHVWDRLREGEDAYLRATVTESLRLRPVVPLAGRRLSQPLRAGGHELPAGTDASAAIWLTHTRPDLYPEPYAFRPERFLDAKPDTYAWIPFGGGVRRCLGAAFAEWEMRIVLQKLAERCDVRLADDRPERIARRNVTFSPRRGTPVVLAA